MRLGAGRLSARRRTERAQLALDDMRWLINEAFFFVMRSGGTWCTRLRREFAACCRRLGDSRAAIMDRSDCSPCFFRPSLAGPYMSASSMIAFSMPQRRSCLRDLSLDAERNVARLIVECSQIAAANACLTRAPIASLWQASIAEARPACASAPVAPCSGWPLRVTRTQTVG